MIRRLMLCALALTLFAACNKRSDEEVVVTGSRLDYSTNAPEVAGAPPPPPAAGAADALTQKQNAPKLAYSHSVSLEMAADKVSARYERARNSCLSIPAFGCTLVYASISLGDQASGAPPYAQMTVRLPHDKIAGYQKELISPLEGEKEGQPVLRASTTNAEDLTYVIADSEARLKQLQDYRDRLMELAKTSGAKVGDLIQIEEKISETQSQIEQLTASQRQLNLRVDTEILSIDLRALPTIATARSPLAEAWRNAGDRLGQSAAEIVTFVVSNILWVPIIAIGLWLLVRAWRFARGRIRLPRAKDESAG